MAVPKGLAGYASGTDRYHLGVGGDNHRTQPTAFSRDAVGIVIFGQDFSLLCTTASLSHCCGRIRRARLDRGARAGSKRHGFSFHGDALLMRLAATLLVAVLGERCARRGGEPAGVAAATCGHAVTVAIGPSGWGRPGRRRQLRHLWPNNIACRRIPPPGKRWRCPAAARLHRHRRLDPAVRRQGRAAGRYRLHLLPARRRRSRHRPVTFLFNGGPGASSAWLQFGDAGPWRVSTSVDGAVSSATPDLPPNAETWLHFTDLVFIDPVGTGYSRFVASGEEVRKRFYSVDGDVSADRARDPPLAGEIRSSAVAEICRRRELWRHPRTEDRAQSAVPSRASACAG